MTTATKPSTLMVSYDNVEYNVVREGLAEILNPVQVQSSADLDGKGKSQAQSVFYNPIQQFNRDLSVLAIRVFSEHLVELRSQKHGKRKATSSRPNKKRKVDEINDTSDATIRKEQDKKEESGLSKTKQDGDSEMTDAPEERNEEDTTKLDNVPTGPRQKPREPLKPRIRVLDALSASGLRALRYAQEIPEITDVVANDLSLSATNAIDLNVKHNKQESKISLHTGDAIDYMHASKGKFEIVDLDPYGTAGPFLDAAVQAMTNGGLLCVTCTDSAVFAATGYCEKTFSVYGGMPIKGPHSHEGGLRLLLHAIATSAAKYGLAVEPMLSLSIDFYIRVFVKIRKSPQEVKFLAMKTMIVYGCDHGCGSWTTQPLARSKQNKSKNGTPYYTYMLAQAPQAESTCQHCGFITHLHGPMWAGPLHNPYFVQNMLDTVEKLPSDTYGTKLRMEGMLSTARDETLLSIPEVEAVPGARIPPQVVDHHPFFFLPSVIAGIVHCNAPSSAQLRGALLRLGYKVTRSHAKAGSIKTNAPWTIIWEIMREWIRTIKPIKEDNIKPGTAATMILDKRRELRDSLSDIKDDLRTISQDKEIGKDDIKTKLEAMLFRLSHPNDSPPDVDGTEENGPKTIEKKTPPHKLKIVFDEELGKKSEENEGKKLMRYQMNPRANWGPMTKARG